MTPIDRAIDPRQFAALLADLGLPASSFTTRADRVHWYRDAAPLLIAASPYAIARCKRTGLPALSLDELPDLLRERTFGDVEFVPLIVDAWRVVPAPVRDALARSIAWLCVGVSSRAWTSRATFRTRDGAVLPDAIALGPDATVDTALHEIAHVLCDRPAACASSQAVPIVGEIDFAVAADLIDIDALRERGDRFADALGAAWTFAHEAATRPEDW